MVGMKTNKVYGDPLTELNSLLRNLRLSYKEVGRNTTEHYVEILFFGLKIKFAGTETENEFVFDKSAETDEVRKFGEKVVLELISRGYMAYVRENEEASRGQIYRALLIKEGWGRKIVERRLSAWTGRKDREFIRGWTKEVFDKFSIIELVDRYPTFFDYLYF